jgi:5-carboxymethyl-2-hydroxymuconate isomerase
MPHFIMDCSESVFESYSEEQILEQIYIAANSTGLFNEDDIKVRVNPYKKYLVGNKREDFIHVFAYIMEGRSAGQKADLSKRVVQKLTSMFPKMPKIAMNVSDFDRATYCNRDML